MNLTKLAITLAASLILSPIAVANESSGNNTHSIMQTAKTTILEDLLKSFGDLAIKIPADGKEQYSIVMLYDNQCKYCNDFLMNIPDLTAHGVSVFVMPFLNHGAYSQQAKSMYLAWSTKQPLMSLLKKELPSQPDPKMADRIFEFTKFAQNQLNVTKTPYIILENNEFIDGYISSYDLVGYLKSAS